MKMKDREKAYIRGGENSSTNRLVNIIRYAPYITIL